MKNKNYFSSRKNLIYFFFFIILIFNIKSNNILLSITVFPSENGFDKNLTIEENLENTNARWIGLDLSSEYKITKIGWKLKENEPEKYLLGIFEGANKENFIDGIPLLMITEEGKLGENNYSKIKVSKTFRYIRYISPNNQNIIFSNIEIYGENSSSGKTLYQLSNIPMIVMHTELGIDPIDKKNELTSYIYIIDNSKANIQQSGKIRLRGNESMKYDKKSIRIKFDNKIIPLNFKENSKKWLLIPNYSDKTLIRNLVGFEISKLFQMYFTPTCESVDVMLNGEYKGVYNLCNQIEVDNGRLEITRMKNTDKSGINITGGYHIEVDSYAEEEISFFESKKNVPVTIKYPDDDQILVLQFNYIEKEFNKLERDVYSKNIDRVDIESFSQYFLIEELIGNPDAYWSVHMIKERDNKHFYFVAIWDLELAFDNDKNIYPINEKDDFIFKYAHSAGTMSKLIQFIIQNETALNFIKDKWKNLTEDLITKENIINIIDEKAKIVNKSQKFNFMRWNIMNELVYNNAFTKGSFEKEVDYLKEYIEKRIIWLNNFLLGISSNSHNETINLKNNTNINTEYISDVNFNNYINYKYHEFKVLLYFFLILFNFYNLI